MIQVTLHPTQTDTVAEITADAVIIQSEPDTLRLMEELWGSGAGKIILHQENLAPEFFQLRTGLAGAVLQKFVNYRLPVAIVGDFKDVASDSLNAFIYESNRGSQVFFVESVAAALKKFDDV